MKPEEKVEKYMIRFDFREFRETFCSVGGFTKNYPWGTCLIE